jgi:hypothetical protein
MLTASVMAAFRRAGEWTCDENAFAMRTSAGTALACLLAEDPKGGVRPRVALFRNPVIVPCTVSANVLTIAYAV